MKSFLRILKWLAYLTFAGIAIGMMSLGAIYLMVEPDLPDVELLRDVQLQVPLQVYSEDEKLMAVFGEKRREFIPIEEMPEQLRQAFIAGEDASFYDHPGVDYQGILRAVWHVAKTGGQVGPGGSTLTQQLARHFGFVSREVSVLRKIKEWFLALRIEQQLTKDEILELFLNKAYLGHRAYGVGAAASTYYGKTLDELTLAECAMLASLPKAPSRINPITNPDRAILRRNYVLRRMLEQEFIDQDTFDREANSPDFAFPHEPTVELDAPYAAEMVRAQVYDMLGEDAYEGGFKVYTTFQADLQRAAQHALRKALFEYDRRHGYRGPIQQIEVPEGATDSFWLEQLETFEPIAGQLPAAVTQIDEDSALALLKDGQIITLGLENILWARPYESENRRGPAPKAITDTLAVGDIIRVQRMDDGQWELSQIPEVQGALVSLNPDDGAILALVGGLEFQHSKFNRVTQAKRQPGSSFKPLVYAAAMANGYTPASIINDAPVVFRDPSLERVWKPENYSEQFFGPTRLREGMVNSRNLVSIRLLRQLGIQKAFNYVVRFGFDPEELPRNLSMALGTVSVPPIQMARSYAAFANGGFLVDPYSISRIEDGRGNVIFTSEPAIACAECIPVDPEEEARRQERLASLFDTPGESTDPQPKLAPRIIDEATHYLIDSILKDVVKRGTGVKAMELGRGDLAGKTGTTNDQMDAWFSGYSPDVVATAWVGFDQLAPLGRGEVGGRAALPVWMDFMRVALADKPETDRPLPDGVVFARINPETGAQCGAADTNCILESFNQRNMPPAASTSPSVEGEREEETTEDPYDWY